MKKFLILSLSGMFFLAAGAAEKEFAFFYVFNRSTPQGFPDLAGNLAPVKPAGKWEKRKNTVYLDGKTGRIVLHGTKGVSLKNKTLLALVKFYDSGKKAGTLECSDGLFSRPGDLLTGRDRWQGFYCNYREVRSSAPRIVPGKFMLMAVNIIENSDRKLKIELFINGKRINWPKASVPKMAENTNALLEFGCGRGKEWYFHGEVAMIAMKKKIMSAAEQQRFISDHLSGKVRDLKGIKGDFTVDFFSCPPVEAGKIK